MKKILLLAMAAMMSLCISAQGLTLKQAPVMTMQKKNGTSMVSGLGKMDKVSNAVARKVARRKAPLADNQRILGTYDSDDWEEEYGLGLTNLPGTYEVMNLLTVGEYSKLVGGSISSVRFALTEACNINRVFVYEIPMDDEAPLEVIAEQELANKSCPTGWTTIALDNPCTLPTDCYGIAIGFEYVQEAGAYPLSLIDGSHPGGFLLYGTLNGEEGFYNFSSYGLLCVQGIVDCNNLPAMDIEIGGMALSSYMAAAGSEMMYSIDVRNFGSGEVTSFEMEVSMDGTPVQTITEDDMTITHSWNSYVGSFTLPENLTRGTHTVMVKLTKVNGTAPTEYAEDDVAYDAFSSYYESDVVKRQKHLIEEATSNSCTYCPYGALTIDNMLKQDKNLAVACIHGNQSMKDPYNTPEMQSLLSYLGCTSFPSATFNRMYFGGEEGILTGIGYDESQAAQAASMYLSILEEYSLPAFASVNIAKELNENTLNITVSGKGGASAKEVLKDFSLTVYVLEDSLKYRQLNNGTWVSNYMHRHVVRKVATAINGDDINWTSDSEYSNAFTVQLDPKWVKQHISIVAFISKRQPLDDVDWSNMDVSNANCIELFATEGGEGDDPQDDERVDAGLVISPITDDTMLMGEGMSLNAKYVAGMNYAKFCPAIWNTTTGTITNFPDYDEGSLHAVSSNGVAVGSTGHMNGRALICNVDGTSSVLPDNGGANTQGSDAWAVSDDGSTVAGFYYYFEWTNEEQTEGFYATYPCVWKNGICTNLSYPGEGELDFSTDGAGVRWMSADGKTLLGYVVDDMARWPAVIWRQNDKGGYDCDPICKDYFELEYLQGKPYMLFTPCGISPNGEWVALMVQEEFDDWDFNTPAPTVKIARFNLNSRKLEILKMDINMEASAISNDGSVLAYNSVDGLYGRKGYVWFADSEKAVCLDDKLKKVKDMPDFGVNVPAAFAADGKTIMGFGLDQDTNIYSYVINLDNLDGTGIESIMSEPIISADDRAFNLAGQRVNSISKPGLYIMNGKKYLVK